MANNFANTLAYLCHGWHNPIFIISMNALYYTAIECNMQIYKYTMTVNYGDKTRVY